MQAHLPYNQPDTQHDRYQRTAGPGASYGQSSQDGSEEHSSQRSSSSHQQPQQQPSRPAQQYTPHMQHHPQAQHGGYAQQRPPSVQSSSSDQGFQRTASQPMYAPQAPPQGQPQAQPPAQYAPQQPQGGVPGQQPPVVVALMPVQQARPQTYQPQAALPLQAAQAQAPQQQQYQRVAQAAPQPQYVQQYNAQGQPVLAYTPQPQQAQAPPPQFVHQAPGGAPQYAPYRQVLVQQPTQVAPQQVVGVQGGYAQAPRQAAPAGYQVPPQGAPQTMLPPQAMMPQQAAVPQHVVPAGQWQQAQYAPVDQRTPPQQVPQQQPGAPAPFDAAGHMPNPVHPYNQDAQGVAYPVQHGIPPSPVTRSPGAVPDALQRVESNMSFHGVGSDTLSRTASGNMSMASIPGGYRGYPEAGSPYAHDGPVTPHVPTPSSTPTVTPSKSKALTIVNPKTGQAVDVSKFTARDKPEKKDEAEAKAKEEPPKPAEPIAVVVKEKTPLTVTPPQPQAGPKEARGGKGEGGEKAKAKANDDTSLQPERPLQDAVAQEWREDTHDASRRVRNPYSAMSPRAQDAKGTADTHLEPHADPSPQQVDESPAAAPDASADASVSRGRGGSNDDSNVGAAYDNCPNIVPRNKRRSTAPGDVAPKDVLQQAAAVLLAMGDGDEVAPQGNNGTPRDDAVKPLPHRALTPPPSSRTPADRMQVPDPVCTPPCKKSASSPDFDAL